MIEDTNTNAKNFYGGEIWANKTYGKFFNSPKLKGSQFSSRRRCTEKLAKKKILAPSPTFNCVGPGAVGTGTLAGMRILNMLKSKTKILEDKLENEFTIRSNSIMELIKDNPRLHDSCIYYIKHNCSH